MWQEGELMGTAYSVRSTDPLGTGGVDGEPVDGVVRSGSGCTPSAGRCARTASTLSSFPERPDSVPVVLRLEASLRSMRASSFSASARAS